MTKPYPGLPGFNLGEPLPPTKPAWQHSLIDHHEFLTDCARYIEGLYSREQVKRRWRNIDDATWDLLGGDNELVDAISAESLRRVRDGSAKREKAQQLIVKGPEILDGIMSDTKASPKHKVDAIKTLDALAANGPGAAPEQDRVVIRIDLTAGGGDVLRFDGSVKPTPGDAKVIEHEPRPRGVPGFEVD